MFIMRVLCFLVAVLAFQLSYADALSERNLPPGTLIYTDSNDSYYGVYTGDRLADPSGVGIDPAVVALRIIAFREPAADGSLVKVSSLRVDDGSGNEVDGYRYDDSESDLLNEHIMPFVERTFPERRGPDYIQMLVYAADQYYSNGRAYSNQDEADLEEPEEPLSRLQFARGGPGQPMRPGYEARGTKGVPKDWLSIGLQDLRAARTRLPASIAARRTGLQSEKTARYRTDPADSDTITGINNPDGMYLVGIAGGISELKLFRPRDDDGSYAVDAIKPGGEKRLDGWWYPDTQQFWAQEWLETPGNDHCNQMSEHRWTHTVAPGERLAGARRIQLFAETSGFGGNREPRTCVNARMNPNTCEILSCNRYSKLPPRFFIVASEEDAQALDTALSREFKEKCKNPAGLHEMYRTLCATL